LNNEKSALIIIDLQNDFTLKTGKAHACSSQADIVIPRINELIETCENKNIEVIYFKTEWKNFIIKLLTKNSVKVGSHGAQFDDRLTHEKKNVFIKNDKNIFSNKDFVDYLKKNNIKKLFLSGLALEYCINTSFKEAQKINVETNIVSDAIISYKCTELTPLLNKYFPNESLVLSSNII